VTTGGGIGSAGPRGRRDASRVTWRLVLWGIVIGIPVAVWLAQGSGPSPEFTQKWVWTFRGLVVIAVGIEIAKWAKRRQG
jgi:hypothetical protein